MGSRRAGACCCGTQTSQPCAAHFNACIGPPPVVVGMSLDVFFRRSVFMRVGVSPQGVDVSTGCPWREVYRFRARLYGTAVGVFSSYSQTVINLTGNFREEINVTTGVHYCPDPCQTFPGCFPFVSPCVTQRYQWTLPASFIMACTLVQLGNPTLVGIEGGASQIGGATFTNIDSGSPYCGGGTPSTTTTAVNAGFFASIVQRGCTTRPTVAIMPMAPAEAVPTPNYVIPGYSWSTANQYPGQTEYTSEQSGGACAISYAAAAGTPVLP